MPADRVRTTISVDPAVLAAFQHMADLSGRSVSRCMGDWLADTVDGANLLSQKLAQFRSAPRAALGDVQGLLASATREADALMAELGAGAGRQARQGRAGRAGAEGAPPSSLTGVKSPKSSTRTGRKS